MMITDQGLSIIAQQVKDLFTKGEVGTDNTTPTNADTDLVSPITATQKDFSEKNSTANLITLVYELSISEANNNAIKEFGTFMNNNSEEKLISRFVHPAINKTDQIALVYKVEYLVDKK